MYSIIKVGSQQFRVAEGDCIYTNRLDAEKGSEFVVDQVLLLADDKGVRVGQPFLSNVKVVTKVEDHPLGNKVTAFQSRRRKDSARKVGHRQRLTCLRISRVEAS